MTNLKLLPALRAALLAAAINHLVGLATANAQASIPKLINYQGRLTDATGQPLSNGTYQVRFELFGAKDATQPGGTNVIWGATYTNLVVVSGQFNVVLGTAGGIPLPGAAVNDIGFAFGDSERYLQMTIETGAGISAPQTLAPRQQFLSVPYALNGVPTGTILPFGGTVAPPGFLFCEGQSLQREKYPALFQAIAKSFGAADEITFNAPDLRGRFLRGVDGGAGRDPDKNQRILPVGSGGAANGVGSTQPATNRMHSHTQQGTFTTDSDGQHHHRVGRGSTSTGTLTYAITWGDDGGYSGDHIDAGNTTRGEAPITIIAETAGSHSHHVTIAGSTESSGGSETRPANIYVNFIIKY